VVRLQEILRGKQCLAESGGDRPRSGLASAGGLGGHHRRAGRGPCRQWVESPGAGDSGCRPIRDSRPLQVRYFESLWVHSPPLGAKYQPGLAPWVHTFDSGDRRSWAGSRGRGRGGVESQSPGCDCERICDSPLPTQPLAGTGLTTPPSTPTLRPFPKLRCRF
jgi:hypothetical protein